jgi:tetratricopeptide (TPR) repeat protein
MSAAGKIVAISLAALSVCGCPTRDEPAPSDAAPAPSSSTATSAAPKSAWKPGHKDGTTTMEVAVRNYEKQLARAEKKLGTAPNDVAAMSAVVSHLLLGSSRLGRLAGLDRATALGDEAVEKHPADAAAYLLRANTRAAVHRFKEALQDLDAAKERGSESGDMLANRSSILAGLGQFEEARTLAEASLAKRKTFVLRVFHASVVGRMGKLEEAEKLFAEAEASFTGVSPFSLARLYFDWGAMWDRAGKPAEALVRYRAAVARLPGYAHAVGHLAALVPAAEATNLLEAVVKISDDPEYKASLAVLRNKQDPGSGAALLEEATLGYAELMKKHPLAFADHAGWFYLDVVRKPDRAVEVAEQNLEARQVPEAYELIVASLVAAEERDEACQRADEGVARKYGTVALTRFAARAYAACGRRDEAAELRAKIGE